MAKRMVSCMIVAIMVLAGCATIPTKDIKIDAQADPKANFKGYKTYDWLGAAAILNDPYGQWEPPEFDADAEVTFLIDKELRNRGMMPNATNPDMLVAYAAGIDMDALELKVNPETKIDVVENVPQGGLLIVLLDADTGFVIWAGAATAEVQEDLDTNAVKGRLAYAVNQMFKKLPR